MKVKQITSKNLGEVKSLISEHQPSHGFCLYFCSIELARDLEASEAFSGFDFPILGCSTSGEISDQGTEEKTIVLNFVSFDSDVQLSVAQVDYSPSQERSAGQKVADSLKSDNLDLIFTLGIGVNINGSEFVRGIQDVVGSDIPITGGLAGDDGAFSETYVGLGGTVANNQIVAIGLGGGNLKVAYGSRGGWEPFGPERRVTKAEGNVLYEIDGKPALEIYKSYLGEKANELPGSGLLYPFAVVDNDSKEPTIRTILGIDEETGSLTMAGEVNSETTVQLMHTGSEGLINGAGDAASLVKENLTSGEGLAVLVSCVGRKLVMGEDVDDEIDAVRDLLGENVHLSGFYSNGEICPYHNGLPSKLHNQTMTITYISEG